jgi:hypothetical protein
LWQIKVLPFRQVSDDDYAQNIFAVIENSAFQAPKSFQYRSLLMKGNKIITAGRRPADKDTTTYAA